MTNLPPGTTADFIHGFIYHHWETIAILAYTQYQKQGRGMVLWRWDLKPESGKDNFLYVPEEILIKIYDEELLTKVRNYDPEETVMIGVVWQVSADREKTYYVQFKKEPSPASLFEMPKIVRIIL